MRLGCATTWLDLKARCARTQQMPGLVLGHCRSVVGLRRRGARRSSRSGTTDRQSSRAARSSTSRRPVAQASLGPPSPRTPPACAARPRAAHAKTPPPRVGGASLPFLRSCVCDPPNANEGAPPSGPDPSRALSAEHPRLAILSFSAGPSVAARAESRFDVRLGNLRAGGVSLKGFDDYNSAATSWELRHPQSIADHNFFAHDYFR